MFLSCFFERNSMCHEEFHPQPHPNMMRSYNVIIMEPVKLHEIKHKLESITPTSGVVDENLSSFSKAVLWQKLLSCCTKPSFQLQNPLVSYKITKIHQS